MANTITPPTAPLISFFKNGITDTEPNSHITPAEAIEWIKQGKFKEQIENLRAHGNKENDKIKLSYFTWSGTFHKRHSDALIEHSGFICLDFDDVVISILESMYTKKEIMKLPYVYAVFISPSGTGLKVIIKINPKKHQTSFLALRKVFKTQFQITVDDKAKDIPRACFVSYDQDCLLNENCSTFNPKDIVIPADVISKPEAGSESKSPLRGDLEGLDYDSLFTRANNWAEKNGGPYADGNRNNFVYQFACQCNRLGIPELHAQQYSISQFADYPEKEMSASIRSAYNNHINEFGKLIQRNRLSSLKGRNTISSSVHKNESAAEGSDDTMVDEDAEATYQEIELYSSKLKTIYGGEFWQRTLVYDEKDNSIKEEKVTCNYVALAKFLASNGFSRLPIKRRNAPDIFQFIRIQKNVVKQVNEQNMKDFVFDWMEENKVPEKVVEAFIRGSKNYFNTNTLDRVPLKELKFKRDTREEAFFYYMDCFVCVTAEKIEMLEYEDLDAPIWSSQQLDRKLNYTTEIEHCVFGQFMMAAATGRDGVPAERKDLLGKFLSICSGVGYMLHSYKDEANAKTFNIFDAKISYDKKPEGRSGKSMIFRAIGKMKPTVILDGKKIDLRKPESFAKVNLDTAVIVFNDVSRNFNFEMLFHMITEEITVKKLYMDLFSIPFEDSAKIGITGNYTLKGDGGSFSARQFNVTLTDFFNPDNRPDEYFGKKLYPETITPDPNGGAVHFKRHRFFYDWDEAQWNLFDSFMLQCVQQYLADGLLAHDDPNYELKKLLDDIPHTFYDFMEEVERGVELDKKELLLKFKDENDMENLKPNSFNTWLIKYCDFKNIRINPEHPPKGAEKYGRNRKAGHDYIFLEGSKEKKLPPSSTNSDNAQNTAA